MTAARGGGILCMNNLLDIARGAYSRLPPQTRSTLASFLRFIPEDLKWGSSYRAWRAVLTEARNAMKQKPTESKKPIESTKYSETANSARNIA